MAKRKKLKQIHRYDCSLTGENFKTTRKVDNPDELISVKAYYELHAEDDDRPANIKKQLGVGEEAEIVEDETETEADEESNDGE